MRAQGLIFASFITSLFIILLAFSLNALQTYILKEDEELNTANVYYFYTQAIAYSTQKAMHEYIDRMLIDPRFAIEAANYAEKLANWYLNQSYYKAKRILPSIDLKEINEIKIFIKNNGIIGNGSFFSVLVFKNNDILANITFVIKRAQLVIINSSINVYYKLSIYVLDNYYIKENYFIYNTIFKINVFTINGKINFIEEKQDKEISIMMDYRYKDHVIISIENPLNIVGWLLG